MDTMTGPAIYISAAHSTINGAQLNDVSDPTRVIQVDTGGNNFTLQLLDPAGDIQKGDVLFTNGSDSNRPYIPGVPVGRVSAVDHTSATLTQTATVKSYSDLGNIGVVAVVVGAPTTAPRTPINPTPVPTVIVYVTPTPTPIISGSPLPTPSPSATSSKKATK